MLDRQHVRNFLDRGVHDEATSEQEHHGRKIETAFNHTTEVNAEKWLGQRFEQANHDEQQGNAQRNRNQNSPASYCRLMRDGRTLGLNRDL